MNQPVIRDAVTRHDGAVIENFERRYMVDLLDHIDTVNIFTLVDRNTQKVLTRCKQRSRNLTLIHI